MEEAEMHQSYKMHFGSCGFLNFSWSFSGWQASNGMRLFSGFSSQKQLNFGPCALIQVTSAEDGQNSLSFFSIRRSVSIRGSSWETKIKSEVARRSQNKQKPRSAEGWSPSDMNVDAEAGWRTSGRLLAWLCVTCMLSHQQVCKT